jgi:hypothetical protein
VGMAKPSTGGTAGGAPTQRAVTDPADLVAQSWTASTQRKATRANKSALNG